MGGGTHTVAADSGQLALRTRERARAQAARIAGAAAAENGRAARRGTEGGEAEHVAGYDRSAVGFFYGSFQRRGYCKKS
jgi:hypothetical protein